jgi:hypothetical protein
MNIFWQFHFFSIERKEKRDTVYLYRGDTDTVGHKREILCVVKKIKNKKKGRVEKKFTQRAAPSSNHIPVVISLLVTKSLPKLIGEDNHYFLVELFAILSCAQESVK